MLMWSRCLLSLAHAAPARMHGAHASRGQQCRPQGPLPVAGNIVCLLTRWCLQVFYSDDLTQEISLIGEDVTGRPVTLDTTFPLPLSELSAAQNASLLGTDDPWYQATESVSPPPPPRPRRSPCMATPHLFCPSFKSFLAAYEIYVANASGLHVPPPSQPTV